MSMLVLTVLGASMSDIMEDYLYTNVSRDAQHDEMFAKFLRIANGDEDQAERYVQEHRARRENIEAFLEAVCESYGNIDSFVHDQLGVGDALREEFRQSVTE